MKDFVIYLQPKPPTTPPKEKYSVEELKSLPSSSTLTELGLVKGGELSFVRQTEFLNVFSYSGDFQLPRPQAAGGVAHVPMNFNVWQQRGGHFVASFMAPKKLSKIAIALLSYATHRDPFLIKPVQLTKSDFISLKDYILKRGGDLKQLIFWNIRGSSIGGAKVTQWRLSGSALEKFPDFDEYLKHFPRIRLLGFSFKPTAECRDIRFRIIDWGGGQFYSPADPVAHEILQFLDLFDNTLIPGKSSSFKGL